MTNFYNVMWVLSVIGIVATSILMILGGVVWELTIAFICFSITMLVSGYLWDKQARENDARELNNLIVGIENQFKNINK